MKKLNGKITISRPSYADDQEFIELNISDDSSQNKFLRVKIKPDDFARALTGQGHIPVLMEAQNLEHVGKIKEVKVLKFDLLCKDNYRERASLNCQNYADEGWTAVNSFNSQSSFTHEKDIVTCRTTQFRYVEPKND